MTSFRGTNQDVINIFFAAFGEPDYFDVKMVNAGLAHLADDRQALYTGPAVEDLPNLSEADRQALIRALMETEDWPQFNFTVDRANIQAGDTVTFSWRVSDGVEGIYFWNGATFEGVGGTDARAVRPKETSAYVLKVIARQGQEFLSDEIQVVVSQHSANYPVLERLKGFTREQQLVGMHILGDVEEGLHAWDLGCRVFMVMDNSEGANILHDKGAVVMRRVFSQAPLTPEEVMARMDLDTSRSMILTYQNEDNWHPYDKGPDSFPGLHAHFEQDKHFCELVWQKYPNHLPAIGTFSVGNPPLEQSWFAPEFRNIYAAFLNTHAGHVAIDFHLYANRRWRAELPFPTDNPKHEDVTTLDTDQKWWVGRPATWLYDPNFGGVSRDVPLVCSEWGIEAGAQNGMKGAGYNDQHALMWWDLAASYYRDFEPMKCAVVFNGSRDSNWQRYDVRYLWPGAFHKIWTGTN